MYLLRESYRPVMALASVPDRPAHCPLSTVLSDLVQDGPVEESMRVLVTGATGHVGRIVMEQLVAAGVRVRAMTRRPQRARFPDGVETVAGDLLDPAALSPVLADVDRMYLFPLAGTAREVVTLARQAGVGRIVVLSSAAVSSGADTSFHRPVQRAVGEF